ncbi:MAG: VOC family protein [Burkholderiales bacterium]|jgi:catechol 2,3-dioxygenase-like lactoylglutathione lyase family enzyme|nr:VOC family protein [Burkholderiales bacterium]
MKLNTIRLFVSDLVAARDFYASALGLPLKADGGEYGYCVFDAGGCTLVVEAVAADAPPDDLQLVGRFTGLSFEVADIDAVYDTLRGRGVVFAASPERQGWGGTVATLRDPAGNELQIYAWSRA